jgi:hypothetical protein
MASALSGKEDESFLALLGVEERDKRKSVIDEGSARRRADVGVLGDGG